MLNNPAHFVPGRSAVIKRNIRIGICQVFTGPIDDLKAPAPEADRLHNHLQNLYDTAVEEGVDFLSFPQYKTALVDKIQTQQIEKEAPALIMSGSHIRKMDHLADFFGSDNLTPSSDTHFEMDLGVRHVSLAERYADPGGTGNCRVLSTAFGNFGISAGVDILFEDFSSRDIIGLFILTNRAGVSSFINNIHKLFAVNKSIRFIAFTNGSTNIPYRFLYTRQQVYALNMGRKFREHYREDTGEGSHYVLKEGGDRDKVFRYLDRYMYTSGYSGLFCRKYDLEKFDSPHEGDYNPKSNYWDCNFNEKVECRIREYGKISALYSPGKDIIQLTSKNELSTDYLMIYDYNFETGKISFADVIEIPALAV